MASGVPIAADGFVGVRRALKPGTAAHATPGLARTSKIGCEEGRDCVPRNPTFHRIHEPVPELVEPRRSREARRRGRALHREAGRPDPGTPDLR
jgi:hypothetical protein